MGRKITAQEMMHLTNKMFHNNMDTMIEFVDTNDVDIEDNEVMNIMVNLLANLIKPLVLGGHMERAIYELPKRLKIMCQAMELQETCMTAEDFEQKLIELVGDKDNLTIIREGGSNV